MLECEQRQLENRRRHRVCERGGKRAGLPGEVVGLRAVERGAGREFGRRARRLIQARMVAGVLLAVMPGVRRRLIGGSVFMRARRTFGRRERTEERTRAAAVAEDERAAGRRGRRHETHGHERPSNNAEQSD